MVHKSRNKAQKSHLIDQLHSEKSAQYNKRQMPTASTKEHSVELSHQGNAHAMFSPRTTLDQGRGH